MKRLYAVRHGSYNSGTGELTGYGFDTMRYLAEVIHRSWEEMKSVTKPVILSSEVKRAYDSAYEIAKRFNTTWKTVAGLAVSDRMSDYVGKTYHLAKHYIRREPEVETLIIVSHELHIKRLPVLFAKEQFGLDWPEKEIDTATGWMIDCEAKTITYLP